MGSSPQRHGWIERYGPWAVITGASSGIGRATAQQLGHIGIHLVLVARSHNLLEALATELRTQHAVEVRVIVADLSHSDGISAVQRDTAELDVGLLIAAAGFGTSGPFVDSSLEQELDMLHVNCQAVLVLTHHFARRLAQRRRGGMVLFGSIVGYQGTPNAAHYAATKGYVQSLGEALHIELAPYGVDVLVSAPGPTDTGFAGRARMRMGLTATADTVARATLGALGRQASVLPGLLTKSLAYPLALLPRWARVRVMGIVMRGMTASDNQLPPIRGASQ